MDLMDYRRKIIANSPHLKSASGAVATFSDGADLPLKSLNVGIEPVQDLYGYDNPWPAGGGKNLLQCHTSGGRTNSGITWTYNSNGSVTASGKATGNSWSYGSPPATVTLSQGTYTASVTSPFGLVIQNLTDGGYFYNGGNSKVTFTLNKQTQIGVHARVANGTTINATTGIQIEKGSTATAWLPYENICPISGWNGVNLTRCGKNLFNPHVYTGIAYNPTVGNTVTLTESAVQFTDNGNGVFTATTSATWRYFNIVIPIDPTKEYATKIAFSSTGQAGVTRGYLDADFKILTKFNSTDSAISWEYSLTPETNAAYYYFVFTNRETASATLTLTQPQFVEGTSVGDYEPYNGITLTTDLGQTVYGGVLNVLTGELVTCPYYASYNGETLTGRWVSDRDKYVAGTTPTIGAQVVDMSGTGTEIQLTPQQIRSLYGNNTIFANTGNVALEYWAHA